ncbi:nudC domain-containing protein 2 [Patella vulgata]|uniref:nudC domain-containing protein 2 n=1 Tax=Patella vulgata TaxID=6465 RepID=UPI00217F41B9|nr:nudC domain-containing protein 2 [Patella vulgata]
MTDFDERSGAVVVKTDWGQWFQSMEDLNIEINVPPNTKAKDIKCDIGNKHLSVDVHGNTIINGDLTEPIHTDDAVWTLEDGKLLRICLSKTYTTPDHCWKSLLIDQYQADSFIYDEMQKKLTLESFQKKNPGFDFSGASISGKYQDGGPSLPDT